ncbi:hypothetical protein [Clostridium beijerinckii]|uniref:Uncharacterized protein n=1 Tax=Clostridium beijerinckii TaxID=1520 RepID=A0AAX0B137_CLOBE|nr:hypothetical protein [Clostridium beijerinckii]NRT88897.1 hypothetical protein [Clostridium beijerinckii]NYC74352.1 hypothetical protein [Clostridium beijerinckii]
MEEKKKRSKCATSSRHPFILNSRNPKEKVILDFLNAQYNEGGTIKEILYRYIVDNNLQVNTQHIISSSIVNDNKAPINSVVNDNSMSNDNISIDKRVVSECIVNDNKIHNDNTSNNKSQPFKMEFDESDNEIAEVSNKKEINPEEAALQSLTNMWQ